MRVWVPDEVVGGLKQILEGKPEFEVLLSSVHNSESDLGRSDREEIITEARRIYAAPSDDDISIDEDAQMSYADGGTWVQAWLWVPQKEE